MATLEELLAGIDSEYGVQPPIMTPIPQTPIAQTTPPSQSFATKLKRLGSITAEEFAGGAADVIPNYINTVKTLYNVGLAPSTYTGAYQYAKEKPLEATEQALRGIGSTALRVGGGAATLAVSSPLIAKELLKGNFKTAGLTGVAAMGAGQAAGGLLFKKTLQALGVDPETVPEEDWRQFVRESSGNIFSAGLEKSVPTIAKKSINKVANVYQSQTAEIGRKIAPATTSEINEQAAKTLQELGITKESLARSIEENKQLNNPLDKNLTLADLTGNPDIAVAEAIVQKSPGGARQFALAERKQVAEIEKTLQDIYIGKTQGPASSLTPEQVAIGEKLQAKLDKMRSDATMAGNAMYKDIPDVKISTTDLKKELTKAGEELWNEAKGSRLSSRLDYILKYLKQEEPAVPYATSKLLPTESTTSKLISARSSLLEESRKLAAAGNLDEAKLAGDAAELVNKKLLNDETKFAKDPNIPKEVSEKFKAANDNWRELHDTYHKGFLINLAESNIISPENVVQHVTSNLSSWRQFLKQVNNDPEAIKDILSIKFKEFSQIKDVEGKLAWVQKNRQMFKNSPMDDTLANAERALKNIENVYSKQKGVLGEQKGRGGETLDINSLSNLDDVSKMGLTGSTYANAASRTIQAGITQFTRDKIRQATALALGGAGYGLLGAAGSAVAAPIILAGTAAVAARKQGHLQKLNETLAAALRDPKYALKLFDDIGAADKARKGLKEALTKKQLEAGEVFAPKQFLEKARRGESTLAEQLKMTLLAPKYEQKETLPSLDETIDSAYQTLSQPSKEETLASPTPVPTATPSKLQNLLSSIEDVIIPKAEAETRNVSKPIQKDSIENIAQRLRERGPSPDNVKKVLNLRPKVDSAQLSSIDMSKYKNVDPRLLKQLEIAFKTPREEMQKRIKNYYSLDKIKQLVSKQDPMTQAQAHIESSLDHSSINETSGAIGLMQITPKTARWLGVNPFRAEDNLSAGKAYREQLHKQFKNMDLALAAYNWGPGNVEKALNKLKKIKQPRTYSSLIKYDLLPEETKEYVSKVKDKYKLLVK